MKIAENMSKFDRIIRFIVVVAIIVMLWAKLLEGTLKSVLGIIAIILMITVVCNFCPIYALLKISTRERGKDRIE